LKRIWNKLRGKFVKISTQDGAFVKGTVTRIIGDFLQIETKNGYHYIRTDAILRLKIWNSDPKEKLAEE